MRELTDEAWELLRLIAETRTPCGGFKLTRLTPAQVAELRDWGEDEVWAVTTHLIEHRPSTVLKTLHGQGLLEPLPQAGARISGRLSRKFPPTLAGAEALVEALEQRGASALASAYGLNRPGVRRWARHVAKAANLDGLETRMEAALEQGDQGARPVGRPPGRPPGRRPASPAPPPPPAAAPLTLADRLERLGRQFPPTLDGLRMLKAYRDREQGWEQLAAHLCIDPAEIERHYGELLEAVAVAA